MNKRKILFQIITIFILSLAFAKVPTAAQAGIVPVPNCSDECSYIGQACANGGTCGNYDSDPCLECSSPPPPSCQDECSYIGQTQKRCSGNYVQENTCGNYDSDSCLDWSGWSNTQNCGTSSWTDNYQCSGNWVQRQKIERGCSNSQCYQGSQWINYQDCAAQNEVCQNGQCVYLSSTVDLKANGSDGPITVAYKDRNSLNLSWTSQNSDSCTASGDWSGNKATSGSQTISLSQVKTYTFSLTCKNNTTGNSNTDSVQVTLQAPSAPTVITKGAVITY